MLPALQGKNRHFRHKNVAYGPARKGKPVLKGSGLPPGQGKTRGRRASLSALAGKSSRVFSPRGNDIQTVDHPGHKDPKRDIRVDRKNGAHSKDPRLLLPALGLPVMEIRDDPRRTLRRKASKSFFPAACTSGKIPLTERRVAEGPPQGGGPSAASKRSARPLRRGRRGLVPSRRPMGGAGLFSFE